MNSLTSCTCAICVETLPLSVCPAVSKRPECWKGQCFVSSLPRSAFCCTFSLLLFHAVSRVYSLHYLPTDTNIVILLQRAPTVAIKFSSCALSLTCTWYMLKIWHFNAMLSQQRQSQINYLATVCFHLSTVLCSTACPSLSTVILFQHCLNTRSRHSVF